MGFSMHQLLAHGFRVVQFLMIVICVTACQLDPGVAATSSATNLPTRAVIRATAVPTAGPLVATHTPTLLPTDTLTPTASVTLTPTATQTFLPTETALPTLTPTVEPFVTHYALRRPISESGIDEIDRTYPYGSTQNGVRETHHGVEFVNPRGTPVLAAANGQVVFAGSDSELMPGPRVDYYGQAVVIEHGVLSPDGQTVYTLYGHLDRIDVEVGQNVEQGDRVGVVGDRGIAIGPHLHFEVRVGDDPLDFYATQNPDLWLFPFGGSATLVGRVTGPNGELAMDVTVQMRRAGTSGPAPYFAYTYANSDVNSSVAWGENFTRGDLRPGEYEVFISTSGGRMLGEALVELEARQTTWVEFALERLPEPQPTPTLIATGSG